VSSRAGYRNNGRNGGMVRPLSTKAIRQMLKDQTDRYWKYRVGDEKNDDEALKMAHRIAETATQLMARELPA